MGNCDNLYTEIYEDITSMGHHQKFNKLVNKLSNDDKYKHHPVRERWNVALQMIKNDEY